MSVTTNSKAVILRHEQWQSTDQGITPIPETWHDPRKDANCPPGVLSFFLCPNCSNVTAAMGRYSKINELGKLCPDFRCMKCGFIGELYFDRYHNNRPLYALALIDLAKEEIEIRYTHANNQIEASKGVNPKTHSVVGIGPAIGFKVQDSQGKVLLA